MTLEDGKKPSAVEYLAAREGFLNELFRRTQSMLEKEKGATIVAEFGPQEVWNWDSYKDMPGPRKELSIDLQKGLIMSSSQFDFGLTLGKRSQTSHDFKRMLNFEFGLLPRSSREEDKSIQYLGILVNQRLITHGSGRFYIDDMDGKIRVNCWSDEYTFGGKGITSWPQNKILTKNGLNSSLNVVRRLMERAWV